MELINMERDINMKNVECVVISGASAAAIKTGFDAWREKFLPLGQTKKAEVISCAMFGATDLIVFYCIDQGKPRPKFSELGGKTI